MLVFLNFRFRRRMRGASAARHRPRAFMPFVRFFFSSSLLRFYPRLHPASQLARYSHLVSCIGIAFLERRYVESNVFQETVSRSTVPSLKKLLFKQKYACVIVRKRKEREREREGEIEICI